MPDGVRDVIVVGTTQRKRKLNDHILKKGKTTLS